MTAPATDPFDRLYSDLRVARERLCRAQARLPADAAAHRTALGAAIDHVDRVGACHCPQWSRYDLPTTELDAR